MSFNAHGIKHWTVRCESYLAFQRTLQLLCIYTQIIVKKKKICQMCSSLSVRRWNEVLFYFIISIQKRGIIIEWQLIVTLHRTECTEGRQNTAHVYKYLYYVKHFMPWTRTEWAPAAVAHFVWCWQSEPHVEEQAEEARRTGNENYFTALWRTIILGLKWD